MKSFCVYKYKHDNVDEKCLFASTAMFTISILFCHNNASYNFLLIAFSYNMVCMQYQAIVVFIICHGRGISKKPQNFYIHLLYSRGVDTFYDHIFYNYTFCHHHSRLSLYVLSTNTLGFLIPCTCIC